MTTTSQTTQPVTTPNDLQIFPTMDSAFGNGSGDQLWTKDGGFVFISRHSDNFDEMISAGFHFGIPDKS
jgi:hypothetical protein